jgi:hypothetical protein
MKRKKYFIPIVFLALFVVSCENRQTVESVTDEVAAISTQAATVTAEFTLIPFATKEISATKTQKNDRNANEYQDRLEPTASPTGTKTNTLTPTASATNTATATSTATSTFDPANIVTVTPAPPAQCLPSENAAAPFPEFIKREYWSTISEPEVEQEIINYLNRYGPQPIVEALQVAVAREEYWEAFEYQDFTNNGSPDLMFATGFLYIFGCQDGEYQSLYVQDDVTGYLWPFGLASITDGNRNGIPEITLVTNWWSQGGRDFEIYEWDGTNFRHILVPDPSEYPLAGEIFIEATGSLYFEDIDGDYIKEVVAERGIPVWSTYWDGLPWRYETNYYKWDGLNYVFSKREFDAPTYRFQAVQDGDRFSLAGNYNLALAMYQEAIFSDELEWWSPERQANLREVWEVEFGDDPTPTPVPSDPDEYYYLAAYSRYRIMLLHILQGWMDEAEVVYNTLQDKFPEEQVGHQFAEMATIFWHEYQETQDIPQACSLAIDYVDTHSEILFYLGDRHHGDQGKRYTPMDICPFE